MKKAILAALAALLVVGMLGAPASAADPADSTGVIAFHGQATVSPGLYLPPSPPYPAGVTGGYNFTSDPTNHLGNGAVGLLCKAAGGLGVSDCAISVSGDLDPVAGIGAACGISNGNSGSGSLHLLASHLHWSVTNTGWITSAGGTLPVNGEYTSHTGAAGTLAGVVQAQGGQDCVDPAGPGASNFTVVGVIAGVPVQV